MASWCKLCRRCVPAKNKEICEQCERHEAIGFLVVMAVGRRAIDRDVDDSDVGEALSLAMFCRTLETIAYLMEERKRTIRRYDREAMADQRDAQRGARAAYQEGRSDAWRDDF